MITSLNIYELISRNIMKHRQVACICYRRNGYFSRKCSVWPKSHRPNGSRDENNHLDRIYKKHTWKNSEWRLEPGFWWMFFNCQKLFGRFKCSYDAAKSCHDATKSSHEAAKTWFPVPAVFQSLMNRNSLYFNEEHFISLQFLEKNAGPCF